MGNPIACKLGIRAVIPVTDPQRRVSEVVFIISSGSNGSGTRSRLGAIDILGGGFSVDGAWKGVSTFGFERI